MAYMVLFLLALLRVASSTLPDQRLCDPEPRGDTPTFCSNYKNIIYLDAKQTELEDNQRMLEQKIAAMDAKVEARLSATAAELEGNLKKMLQDAPRIAFSASLVDHGEVYRGPSTDKTLVFKRVFSNTGSGYDQNTGIFTAPVKGLYFFSFSTFGYNTHVMGAILMKNGIRQISTYDYPTSDGSDSSGGSVILQLATGDKVYMELWDNGRVYDNLNGHTTFSGFLVFPA